MIKDIKERLGEFKIAEIFGLSMYKPDTVKIIARAAEFQQDSACIVFGDFCGDTLCGAIAVHTDAEKTLAEIRNIATDGGCRHRGVGTALVRAAAERLKAAGFTALIAETDDDAKGFYEKTGFRLTETSERCGVTRYHFKLKL
ncbi:MAG: GNAT family N-acetyltransferase [Oscillospiraceae bacterium]